MGKSTLGNRLLKKNFFTTGNQPKTITENIQIGVSDKYKIIDCPGFGDSLNQFRFFNEYLLFKKAILSLAPINAIVLVVKFDQKDALSFLSAAKDFHSVFGDEGLGSLMLVCIQGSDKLTMSDADFEKCLHASDGYKFLCKKNENKPIPHCLWDSFSQFNYPTQESDFENCILNLRPYNEMYLKFSFQLVERQIRIMELEKR